MVRVADAHEENKRGFGIFWTVNEFDGPRKIANLKHINAWALDIDVGTKEEQLAKIKSGLVPSMVIESKRGFHIYFRAKDAKPEHWNAIMLDRLVPFYGADKNARDLARILRAPGYYHMKDPANPFLIEKVWEQNVGYTERQIDYFYPLPEATKEARQAFDELKKEFKTTGDAFWDRVWELDCEFALERLSGTDAVFGEVFEFKRNASGTKNIYVNGKSTSCWVDASGRIGSLSKGGPTIFQWLKWYGRDGKKVLELMKGAFPELWDLNTKS